MNKGMNRSMGTWMGMDRSTGICSCQILKKSKAAVVAEDSDKAKKIPTPTRLTHPKGKGLVRVRIFQPVPTPVTTRTCNPYGSHNP